MIEIPDQYREERAELEAVLTSGIFARSAGLEAFLQYICERTFQGEADSIKEYNVATQALGRSSDFDQKKDSIVRVEAHRLRKKLQDFYTGPGRNHSIHIRLPAGSYVPQFYRVAESEPEPLPEDASAVLAVTHSPRRAGDLAPALAAPSRSAAGPALWTKLLGLTIAAGVLVMVLVVSLYGVRAVGPGKPASPAGAASLPAAPPTPETRIKAGSSADSYVDRLGNQWGPDRFFTGGEAASVPPRPIARTLDPGLYFTRREGEFSYDIPLRPGTYELRLYFAETVFGEGNVAGGGESSRIFSVFANGTPLFFAADMLSDAGGSNTANIKIYKDIHPNTSGNLHLEFRPTLKEKPFINAIEIVPGTPGKMLPVRIVARDTPLGPWQADHFYSGGQMVLRHEPVQGTGQPELFQNERYGNFSYAIPVAGDSHYTVKLYFCESWFGPGRPGGGGTGSRVFDLYLNGQSLLRNFDIFEESGGSLRALTRTFRRLTPNAQGKLVLQFVPVRNYGLINAIEVIDEGE
jgi:hypothetical protein